MLLGMALVGIEVITAADRQIPGPMGWAIAISVAVCRTGVDRRPARRDSEFRYDAS